MYAQDSIIVQGYNSSSSLLALQLDDQRTSPPSMALMKAYALAIVALLINFGERDLVERCLLLAIVILTAPVRPASRASCTVVTFVRYRKYKCFRNTYIIVKFKVTACCFTALLGWSGATAEQFRNRASRRLLAQDDQISRECTRSGYVYIPCQVPADISLIQATYPAATVEQLSSTCNSDPRCIAFSTDSTGKTYSASTSGHIGGFNAIQGCQGGSSTTSSCTGTYIFNGELKLQSSQAGPTTGAGGGGSASTGSPTSPQPGAPLPPPPAFQPFPTAVGGAGGAASMPVSAGEGVSIASDVASGLTDVYVRAAAYGGPGQVGLEKCTLC